MGDSFLAKIVDGVAAIAPSVANYVLPGSGPLVHKLMRQVAGDQDDSPIENVAAKISADPALWLELQRVAMTHEEKLAEIDARKLEIVNKTMQEEGKSEHWPQYSWRPYWGFVSGTAFFVVAIYCCILGHMAIVGGKTEALSMIPVFISSMAMLFGIPGAILGVAAWHRGKEKRIKAGDARPGMLAGMINAIKGN